MNRLSVPRGLIRANKYMRWELRPEIEDWLNKNLAGPFHYKFCEDGFNRPPFSQYDRSFYALCVEEDNDAVLCMMYFDGVAAYQPK